MAVKRSATKAANKVAKKVAKKAARKVAKKVAKRVVRKAGTKVTSTAAPRPRKAYKAALKTVKTDASVAEFLDGVADAQQRADAQVLAGIFAKAIKKPAKMWGGAIVGYGDYAYVGRSGRSGDWFLGGFSPRKGTLTLYMLGGWAHDKALLAALGPHKLGGGCLYVRRLADVDMKALQALVASAHRRAMAIAPTMMNQRAD